MLFSIHNLLVIQFVASAIIVGYMFTKMLFITLNRYFHPPYQRILKRARMVAGRRRWGATSDQIRHWYSHWKHQQSRRDTEEEPEKMNVSPIPTACDPTQGEAVRYTGGSLRGETSRNVVDTHTTSNNDRNGRSNGRNGNKGSGDGCEVRHDIRCIEPNIGSAKHTWIRAFMYILSPVEKIWQIMYYCKNRYKAVSWY